MNTIEIYSVEENYINVESLNNQSYLLDLSKDPSNYDSIEYFIYISVKCHNNNISNNKDLFVEFKYTNNNTKVESYCNNALLTCITYLTDKGEPTYITNVDLECYKYKEFEKQTDLYISLPTKNKQIAFNGKYFHKTFNSDIITIYLWDVKPTNVEYYTTDIKESTSYNSTNIYKKQDTISSVNVCNKIINYELFNELLYNNNPKVIERFTTFMTTGIDSYKFILDTQIEQQKLTNELKIKYGDIIDDFNEIMKPEFNVKDNRFLQRFQYPKMYTPEMCSFIIGECEKYAHNNGGWTMKRHIKYPTTDLPVEKIPSIFGLVLETLKPITANITKSYGLHDDMVFNISDLFVVKYKK